MKAFQDRSRVLIQNRVACFLFLQFYIHCDGYQLCVLPALILTFLPTKNPQWTDLSERETADEASYFGGLTEFGSLTIIQATGSQETPWAPWGHSSNLAAVQMKKRRPGPPMSQLKGGLT